MRNKILSRRILKFKKRGEKEQKKKREILNFTYHKELSSPPQKKNYTLSSVRASHISCTPLLYANPNLNLKREPGENHSIKPLQAWHVEYFSNNFRLSVEIAPFPPDKSSDYRLPFHTRARGRFEKFDPLVKKKPLVSGVWETRGGRGRRSKG